MIIPSKDTVEYADHFPRFRGLFCVQRELLQTFERELVPF